MPKYRTTRRQTVTYWNDDRRIAIKDRNEKGTNLGTLWRTQEHEWALSRNLHPLISSVDGTPLDNFDKAEILAKAFAHVSINANLYSHFLNINQQLSLDLDDYHDNSPLSYPTDAYEVMDALGKCGKKLFTSYTLRDDKTPFTMFQMYRFVIQPALVDGSSSFLID